MLIYHNDLVNTHLLIMTRTCEIGQHVLWRWTARQTSLPEIQNSRTSFQLLQLHASSLACWTIRTRYTYVNLVFGRGISDKHYTRMSPPEQNTGCNDLKRCCCHPWPWASWNYQTKYISRSQFWIQQHCINWLMVFWYSKQESSAVAEKPARRDSIPEEIHRNDDDDDDFSFTSRSAFIMVTCSLKFGI